jgi:hypothetical protein
VSGDGIPALLTVEEAGALLRIGRTKAYAMAKQWRETEGRLGLPVIDLGHVLRVPRRALEDLIGAELTDVPANDAVVGSGGGDAVTDITLPTDTQATDHKPHDSSSPRTSRARRRTVRPEDQLALFTARPPTT